MRAIERAVCGCDYGGTSWTTREEADRFAVLLGLGPQVRLLELGAGSGWPGLYLATRTGCEAILIDLPLGGLRIAWARAQADGLACRAAVADASALPFPEASFDAVSHSDVLCCLASKTEALAACRRVIREHGRMAFSVIAIANDLAPEDARRAIASGPEFVAAEADYPTLLARTGWRVMGCEDLTPAFLESFERQLAADRRHRRALLALIGPAELAEREATWQAKIAALEAGLLTRTLYLAEPVREPS